MKCNKCGWDYPEDVAVEPLWLSPEDLDTGPVCGVCALELMNYIHGMNRKRFGGPLAERARRDAERARFDKTAKPPEITWTPPSWAKITRS